MELRFKRDKEAGEPHIYGHGVSEAEVSQAIANRSESHIGRRGARIAIGRTDAGRTLRVIYVPDPGGASGYVVTAYDLPPKSAWSYRKRLRKKRR